MKTMKFLCSLCSILFCSLMGISQVSVNTDGTAPGASAILDISSTTRGFLPPRMTTDQRDSMISPAEGLIIYNTDGKGLNMYDGTAWTTPSRDFKCELSQVVDADGNVYNTIMIGQQCWLASNLNTGTMIGTTTAASNNGIIEKYCYNNDSLNCGIYGGLYKWDEMMQYVSIPGAQGICPADWHIPTDDEYETLYNFLGGTEIAGSAMKEAGTLHWCDENTSATNSSRFTGLAGGAITPGGGSVFLFGWGLFWTSIIDDNAQIYLELKCDIQDAILYGSEDPYSLSVRCVRMDP